MSKRIASIITAICLIFSFSTVVFANDMSDSCTSTLVSSKYIVIDGINYIEKTYECNGVLVQTLSLLCDTSPSSCSSTINAYLAQNSSFGNVSNYSITDHTADFNNSKAHSRNSDCCVGHSGEFYDGIRLTSNYLGIDGGQARGFYNGGSNAYKMLLSEEISFIGSGLDISIGSGFDLSFGTSSETASKYLDYGTYTDCVLARCYRDSYEAEGSMLDCTVETTAVIFVSSSTSYAITVDTSYSDVY